MTNTDEVKLNIGGGKNHPQADGWTVVDLRQNGDIILDITENRLPFEDGSVTAIYCSHTLEHIYSHKLDFVLSEFLRVLKPGGICRIVVPDIYKACLAYIFKNRLFFLFNGIYVPDKKMPLGGLLSSWFYSFRGDNLGNGHVHCFDSGYLKYWLKKNRFKNIKKLSCGKSGIKDIAKIGLDLKKYKNNSIFMECNK